MCTWITEKVAVTGAARGVSDWMTVNQVNVFYDHPVQAPFDHAVIIDFVDPSAGVGARVGIELSAASAVELVRAIEAALVSPEAVRDLADERAANRSTVSS
ncbi:DUF6295 family protein [Nocardioides gilvus]|uniref:DUF6295 family protein n=1 Tax=Nocardioides gilvus TaxID=1735589 RepID=UPI000D74F282|nr:DUF6295 family protein [Nocardioides gilvus]